MRTVDPEIWYDRIRKPSIKVSRPCKFGLRQREGVEALIRNSFCDAMKEFTAHTSLQWIKHLVDINCSKIIRYCYALLILWCVLWGILVVVYVNLDFRGRPPLQVNLKARTPDTNVPFPAVAICSNCIISKRALNAYHSFLVSRAYTTKQKKTIMDNLENFGALITLTQEKMDLQFMRLLYDIYPNFNVTEFMYKLSPKCSNMLKRCTWRGHNVECERLFATRATPLGFCCVFNSRYQPEDIHTPPKILDLMGQNYGLAVVVTEEPEDFAAIRRPALGFDVLLFDGNEYPLLEGGSVHMYPVNHNTSAYFALTAHAQYPSPSLPTYSEEWRGCRIKQLKGPRSGRTSYSWCLTECRQRTTEALCNCLPFTLLPNYTDTVCTPEHLYCLNKHKEKLMYYYPGNGADPSLDEELQDSQQCTHCTPDCARVFHTANLFHYTYNYRQKLFKNMLANGVRLANTSVLRFYYQSLNHHIYTVDVNLRWYEVFATHGCQARVLLGISIMTMSELVYHCTIRWAYHFLRRSGLRKVLQRRFRNFLGSRDD